MSEIKTVIGLIQSLNSSLDDRDMEILTQRAFTFMGHSTPQVGDFVRFPDLPVLRRVSHVWWDEKVQTSDGGSFYLDDGYVSFSGSLYNSIPIESLALTPETETGWFWFFHRDIPQAHNGVDIQIPCRVWLCSENAPKS